MISVMALKKAVCISGKEGYARRSRHWMTDSLWYTMAVSTSRPHGDAEPEVFPEACSFPETVGLRLGFTGSHGSFPIQIGLRALICGGH